MDSPTALGDSGAMKQQGVQPAGPKGFTIYSLKPVFQGLLRPTARFLVRAGVTANQVTVTACVLSCALGGFLAFRTQQRRMLLVLPVFLFVRMALNAIDGIMAREFGQKSTLGAYLNELSDVLSDSFLYLPVAFLGIFDPLWIGVVIALSVMTEMAGTVAVMAGASRRYDGPMGKSDRAFVFGALGLWLGAGKTIVPWAAYWLPPALSLLLAATIVNRVMKGLKENARSKS